MFQRMSPPARRVLFWARAEAGRLGSDWIEPEHLLLGLLAEDQRDWMKSIPMVTGERNIGIENDPAPTPPPFFPAETAAMLRQILTASAGPPKADMVNMPLATRSQHVLVATAENAERHTITVLDILRGLMTDTPVANVLTSVGVGIAQVDDAIRNQ